MTKINIFQTLNRVIHKVGNFYEYEFDLYILSNVNCNGYVTLISLTTGKFFYEPQEVVNSLNINSGEWDVITGGNMSKFKLVDSLNIEVL